MSDHHSRDPSEGFYLNQCWVSISDNHLYFDRCAIKLEPKVIQVLQCLADNLDKVVSKEALISEVWKNRVVSDDSLVRCISVLRKHFKNNQVLGLKIDTVAKKGYKLCLIEVASESISNTSADLQSAKRQQNSRQQRWLANHYKIAIGLVLSLILIGLIGKFWFAASEQKALSATADRSDYHRKVLLTTSQKERYPDLSADGSWITYSTSTQKGMAIQVKSLSGLGMQQITSGEFYDHQPTFSPDAKQIVFARITQANDCEIRIISIIGGADRKLAACQAQGVYAMVWPSDGLTRDQFTQPQSNRELSPIYFIDKSSSIAPGRLNRLNPNSGQLEPIQVFAKDLSLNAKIGDDHLNGLGVDDIAISHNADYIAVTLSPMLGVEDIYISPLAKKFQWKRLSFEQTKIHGLAFNASDQALFYSSNRNGTFRLWRTDLSHWKPVLIKQSVSNISEISTSVDGKIAIERWTESSSVIGLSQYGHLNKIVSEKNINWGAIRSPKNQDIVFLSNRSGYAELWLKSKQRLRQLTEFNGPWLMSPSWSADGQLVAFNTNQPNGNRLYLFDFNRQTVSEIEQTEHTEAPFWHPEKLQLYYSKNYQQHYQVWRWDYASNNHTLIAEIAAKAVKLSSDGRLFFTQHDKKGIWTLKKNNPIRIVEDLQPVDWNNWTVSQQRLFYVSRSASTGAILNERTLDSFELKSQQPLTDLLYFSGLSVVKSNADQQEPQIWYSRLESGDADIDLLTPAEPQ